MMNKDFEDTTYKYDKIFIFLFFAITGALTTFTASILGDNNPAIKTLIK